MSTKQISQLSSVDSITIHDALVFDSENNISSNKICLSQLSTIVNNTVQKSLNQLNGTTDSSINDILIGLNTLKSRLKTNVNSINNEANQIAATEPFIDYYKCINVSSLNLQPIKDITADNIVVTCDPGYCGISSISVNIVNEYESLDNEICSLLNDICKTTGNTSKQCINLLNGGYLTLQENVESCNPISGLQTYCSLLEGHTIDLGSKIVGSTNTLKDLVDYATDILTCLNSKIGYEASYIQSLSMFIDLIQANINEKIGIDSTALSTASTNLDQILRGINAVTSCLATQNLTAANSDISNALTSYNFYLEKEDKTFPQSLSTLSAHLEQDKEYKQQILDIQGNLSTAINSVVDDTHKIETYTPLSVYPEKLSPSTLKLQEITAYSTGYYTADPDYVGLKGIDVKLEGETEVSASLNKICGTPSPEWTTSRCITEIEDTKIQKLMAYVDTYSGTSPYYGEIGIQNVGNDMVELAKKFRKKITGTPSLTSDYKLNDTYNQLTSYHVSFQKIIGQDKNILKAQIEYLSSDLFNNYHSLYSSSKSTADDTYMELYTAMNKAITSINSAIDSNSTTELVKIQSKQSAARDNYKTLIYKDGDKNTFSALSTVLNAALTSTYKTLGHYITTQDCFYLPNSLTAVQSSLKSKIKTSSSTTTIAALTSDLTSIIGNDTENLAHIVENLNNKIGKSGNSIVEAQNTLTSLIGTNNESLNWAINGNSGTNTIKNIILTIRAQMNPRLKDDKQIPEDASLNDLTVYLKAENIKDPEQESEST